jgi:hypothetical protein
MRWRDVGLAVVFSCIIGMTAAFSMAFTLYAVSILLPAGHFEIKYVAVEGRRVNVHY